MRNLCTEGYSFLPQESQYVILGCLAWGHVSTTTMCFQQRLEASSQDLQLSCEVLEEHGFPALDVSSVEWLRIPSRCPPAPYPCAFMCSALSANMSTTPSTHGSFFLMGKI